MASAAGDIRGGSLDLSEVVAVDFLGHGVHKACGGLHWFGVIGKIEVWFPIVSSAFRVFDVARIAPGAKGSGPLFHQVVNLPPREVFVQHLQVGWRGVSS